MGARAARRRFFSGQSMYNTRLDGLTEYPFQRLRGAAGGGRTGRRARLSHVHRRTPAHPPGAPDLSGWRRRPGDWGKYPPTAGTPEITAPPSPTGAGLAIACPAGSLDSEEHVLPLAGSREGLFMAAQLCVPAEQERRPARGADGRARSTKFISARR